MVARTSYTIKLSKPEQETLTQILRVGNYRPIRMEHTTIAVATEDCRINLYKSGKCLVQGKGAEECISYVLEPQVLKRVALGYEDIVNPEGAKPRMGVDESGKGDFFGPLVIASAYVDETLVEKMRDMDVRDSKRITSDDKALGMGRELRRLLGRRYSVVKIGPQAYNRLYAKMRSVNTLLAWGHARAIENLLEVIPNCPRAISDQFGSKSQVERALMKNGRQIELEQRPRAEDDLAVAAASVIAREMFLRGLLDMQQKYGVEFKKGASDKVREAAVELVKQHDPTILLETAKCHFKTADVVLAALGTDRKALGPEGQAVSKPYSRDKWKKGSAKEKSDQDT